MSDRRNVLQESLAAIDRLQSRLDAAENAKHEPIAIIGMACRYPGEVETPEALWALLRDGVDAVREVPADRWDIDAFHDTDPQAPGKMVTRRGGFLRQVDQFDPVFYGISPREANTLDPQQRLLLETTTEALERAGIATDSLQGSATGVFVGITTSDYGQLTRGGGPDNSDVYSATGSALNAAAGRISYTFGLQGPCVSMDTACSSSLVAVHLACQSLRAGESRLALAGGVNVVLSPEAMVLFSKWGMMAPDGRCKTFDAAADGFVRAEGCAVVALKRLSDAVAAGDSVLAVIRGSAVNSDGRSSGLTVPNGPAQEALLRTALLAARLTPADIDYVEAHGTGTPLGDPIEIEALARVMREGRDAERPLLVGSVKTNLGHTEAASGVAGLLKVVLSLQHEAIAPHLHLQQLNPRIDWAQMPLAVPTTLTPWPRGSRPRRAGVSSFGFSGTNAHLIIEEAPAPPVASHAHHEAAPELITISGQSVSAVRSLAARYAEHAEAEPQLSLRDMAFTLGAGRAHLRQRCAFVAGDREQLLRTLAAVARGDAPTGLATQGQVSVGERPRVAFVFTGQGSQYAGMGRGLYDSEPVFREVIDQADAILASRLEHRLTDVMFGAAGGMLNQTAYAQPALFALEMALVALWRSWGVTPAVVIGHSVGEYAAACVAGVFSFEDGLALIAERGRLMQALPGGGTMAAVFCAPARLSRYLERNPQALSIAACNGPEETVLSGASEVVQQVLAELAAEGVQGRMLTVSHAFHSPLLEPMLAPFERVAAGMQFAAPQLPLISNVTGAEWAPGVVPDAAYWRTHARNAVQFVDGLRALHARGPSLLIEIGPHASLLGLAAAAVPAATWALAPSLRRGDDDRTVALGALGQAYVAGAAIRWPALWSDRSARRIVLPTYAFQRERHWVPTAVAAPSAITARDDVAGHPLLGTRRDLAAPVVASLWEREISLTRLPWLTDHRVQGEAIVPATAYIEMAIAAGRELLGAGTTSVTRIENHKPLILHEGERRVLQVALTPTAGAPAHFVVHSRPLDAQSRGIGEWTAHMSADVVGSPVDARATNDNALETITALRSTAAAVIDGAAFYEALARQGNQWGPCFQGVRQIWRSPGVALAQVVVPAALEGEMTNYCFHPAVSDSAGHALVAIEPVNAGAGNTGGQTGAFVGAGVGAVRFVGSPKGTVLWAVARQKPSPDENAGIVVGDVTVYDEDGTLVGETLDARLWYLDAQAQADWLGAPSDWLYRTQWEARPRTLVSGRAAAAGTWLVFADRGGVADAIAAHRSATGLRTVLVRPGTACSLVGDTATVRVAEPADYRELMRQIGPCSAVLHLWLADRPDDAIDPSDAGDWRNAIELGPQCLLHLLHAVSALPGAANPRRPRVWLVTSGAQATSPADRCATPAAGMLWGMGRSLAAEHGELWGGLVDLDPHAPAIAQATLLAQEVSQPDADDRIALRSGQRFVARLVRRPRDVGQPAAVNAGHGTLLVSGGLGGIGLAMARWAAQHGAREILLLGRRGLPARAQWDAIDAGSADGQRIAAVRELESMGAVVEVVALDVADRDALAGVLAARTARGATPVRGVVHAAGVVQFEALDTQSADGVVQLTAAKVGGAWNLHDLLADEPLDFFVMCSSSSTLLASPLLGAYAAANAGLDALAWHRRARGQAALSVNWGTWGEVGMAVQSGHGSGLLTGMQGMDTARALAALQELLASGDVQAAVMPVNWAALTAAYPGFGADPFFEMLVDTAAEADGHATVRADAARLREAPRSEQPALLRRYLQQAAGRLLGIAADVMESDTPLSGMGFDSLMAVQLKNGIESELGIVVPMIRLLQGPSIDELVPQLADALDAVPTFVSSTAGEAGDEWEEGSL